MKVVYTTKNQTYRVVETAKGFELQVLSHTGKAVRWMATNGRPIASLAKAKMAARFFAGV